MAETTISNRPFTPEEEGGNDDDQDLEEDDDDREELADDEKDRDTTAPTTPEPPTEVFKLNTLRNALAIVRPFNSVMQCKPHTKLVLAPSLPPAKKTDYVVNAPNTESKIN